ncbi:RNA methyltransferase, TrmH family, group 3 [Bacteroidales bacterium KA00251]|nr:RNA methyltransferase, TrmH family, group 3 [Bacteroidales bacterium KA00251]
MIKEQLLYGIHSVQEALATGKLLDKIFLKKGIVGDSIQQIRHEARLQQIPVQEVPLEKLNRLTRKSHQGCVAIVAPIEYTHLENLIPTLYEEGREPFIIVLDGLTDTRNFGAIARSALCAGADAIVIPSYGSVSVTADAINASVGSLLHIPVCRVGSIGKALTFLRESGINVVIADEKSSKLYFEADLDGPLALVMGNEYKGVSPEAKRVASTSVAIPLQGEIGSLNVSVAAGILLFDVTRRRLQNL